MDWGVSLLSITIQTGLFGIFSDRAGGGGGRSGNSTPPRQLPIQMKLRAYNYSISENLSFDIHHVG